MNRLTVNSTHQVHARKPIMAALLVAGIASFDGAQAALTTGTMLNFSSGVRGCLVGGTFPSNCLFGLTTVTSGSYFGMDTDGDFTAETGERTPITATGPIVYNATRRQRRRRHEIPGLQRLDRDVEFHCHHPHECRVLEHGNRVF